MTSIDCPGSKTFNSTQTRTSSGIFTGSNSRAAVTEAHNAVLNDLVEQVNQASCAGGCRKVSRDTDAPTPTAKCERVWWTLWIMVRCSATANGSVVVDCKAIG